MPRPIALSRLAAVLLLLIAFTGCGIQVDREPALPTGGDEQTVPLRVLDQQGQTLAFVPVTIAGAGPFLFALDTGASTTVVAAEIVEQLGIPVTGEQRRVAGVIGVDIVDVVRVDDWALGEIVLEPAEITVIDLPSPPGGQGLQGLLGSDVLSGFGRVTIDYAQERLELPAP